MCSVTKVFLDKPLVLRSLWGILEGLTWISQGHDDFIICHSASLLWLKFFRGPVCAHLFLLSIDFAGLVNLQFTVIVVKASAPQVVHSIPPAK